jgi:hypothetical protein
MRERVLKLPLDSVTCRKLLGDIDEEGRCVVRLREEDDGSLRMVKTVRTAAEPTE